MDDIGLGIVNILVGIAPIKPAEFVIIQIQQNSWSNCLMGKLMPAGIMLVKSETLELANRQRTIEEAHNK